MSDANPNTFRDGHGFDFRGFFGRLEDAAPLPSDVITATAIATILEGAPAKSAARKLKDELKSDIAGYYPKHKKCFDALAEVITLKIRESQFNNDHATANFLHRARDSLHGLTINNFHGAAKTYNEKGITDNLLGQFIENDITGKLHQLFGDLFHPENVVYIGDKMEKGFKRHSMEAYDDLVVIMEKIEALKASERHNTVQR